MPKPLLPPLTEDNQVTTFGNAGRWEARAPGELERVSEGLDVKPPKLVSAEVDSVPSMWARPLLFELALYDDRHPMHERVLGEWRGLLAVLALKEWCGFPLTTEQIDITDLKNPPDAEDFLQALQKLRPKDTLDPTTTWETLNILLFNGKPIGITSPTTLVCTAVNCFGRISGVPWFKDRFLGDPVSELNDYEKEAVRGWLAQLSGHIKGLPVGDLKASLGALLNSFIGDLGQPPAVPTFSNSRLGLTQNLYKCLNNPVAPGDLPSSVQLVPSPNKDPGTILLVPDSTIPETWEEKPQNVIVWGTKTLATAQSFSGKLKLALPAHVRARNQQDFFTDKLFVIRQEEAFHDNSTLVSAGSEDINFNGVPVTPILPITEELLTYLDVTDLNDRITFDQQNDSIIVRLRLTLSGINGQNKDFEISQKYGAADVTPIDVGPVLAIWPNFRTPDWKAYYTYFTTAAQDTFYAKPFLAADGTPDSQTFSDNRGKVEKEIIKTERFPEAMLCKYKGDEAGILLISVPAEKPSVDGTDWSVGVDFGTSSTTVYRYGKGDAHPQPVAFEDRLFRITAPNFPHQRRFYNDFLSPEREDPPFFSLFQKLGDSKLDEPILDGHIYFLDDYKVLSSAEKIVSDLKWSTNATDREHIKLFLRQLCLQCAAEAIDNGAKKIHWHFSHPLAFTEKDIGQFESIWKEVGKVCESETGVSQKVETAQSESVVTAKFFASTLQNPLATGGFVSGAVCIDIGGETSDISIWQDNKLYWQTSLRFAGRHIFLNLLRENPEFLTNLRVDNTDIGLLKEASTGANDSFYAQADALIRDKGQKWLDKLSTVGSEPAIQPFVQLISLGIAGLLYYVGLLLNHLSNETDFNREIPSIYIGGNGSQILHWMADGSFNHDARITLRCRKHLKHVIREASGFESDNNRGIEISKSPKEEAAYGLVAGKTILDESKNQFNILAGETFTESGIDFGWTEILTAERFEKRLSIPRNKLERIENFIESFNTGLGAEIQRLVTLDETLSGKTHGATIRDVMFEELEKDFQDFSDAKPEDISVEPLFILALKALLEAKTRRWDNMDQ